MSAQLEDLPVLAGGERLYLASTPLSMLNAALEDLPLLVRRCRCRGRRGYDILDARRGLKLSHLGDTFPEAMLRLDLRKLEWTRQIAAFAHERWWINEAAQRRGKA